MGSSVMLESLEGRRLFSTLPAGFTDTTLAKGLDQPTSLLRLSDGRLLVTQKTGALRVIKNGALLPTPALQLGVDSQVERGLLSVEADPNFASNHYIYVYYNAKNKNFAQVSRFTMSGDGVVAGSELRLLQIDPQLNNAHHLAGAMHFGSDGKLYIAVGDNEVPADAQKLTTMHGKLLRINSNGSIPSDNPYYSTLTGSLRSIWAIGLRNPYTFAVDAATGKMFINDVGEKSYEEIDVGRKGANYGWPGTEGPTDNPAYDAPLFAYPPIDSATGVCICGGTFYSGVTQQFPATYKGQYFFGDYVNGFVDTLDPTTGKDTPFATDLGKITDIDTASDGRLLVTTYDGVVHAIKYTGSTPPPVTPPAGGAGSITGYVVNDKNANGKWDSGELGITGRSVWIDLDNDGLLDHGETAVTTGANGKFTFTGLGAGTYKIREVVPAGSRQTSPTGGQGLSITLTAGQASSGKSFQVTTT